MVPVVVISVSPVVSVAAVLVIRSLSGEVVGSIAPRAVGVHVPPVPIMVVLVPVLLVLMVPVTTPRRIVATTIAELPFPLPVSSICVTEVSLVGVIIVIPWVSVHLWAVGGRQVRLLRVKVVRGVGRRDQGVPAGARGLRPKRLLTNHIIFLLLLLLFLRSFLMSHLV